MISDGIKEREAQEREARIAREDLMTLLNTGEGYRFVYRLITGLGAGRMTATETDQTMKNISEQILDDVAHANPDAYLLMMGQLRGLNNGGKNG
ncbi:MAG: hypothetical protein J6M06_00445 [Synergistaceae bacterium]|nr:hypothetical protein [Synergistaceae bacterium]